MPWLIHALTSALHCMSKSNDCDVINVEEGKNTTCSNQTITCTCVKKCRKKQKHCCKGSTPSLKKQHCRALNMNDRDNNNCPDLKSKEKKANEKPLSCPPLTPSSVPSLRQRSFKYDNQPGSSSSLPPGALKSDIKDFSKFSRAPNNPHRTKLCRHSSARLPSVYSSPKVMKWPHHRSLREASSRPHFESTTIHPPPNRTLVRTERGLVVSVTGNEQTTNDQSGFVLEKQVANQSFPMSGSAKKKVSTKSWVGTRRNSLQTTTRGKDSFSCSALYENDPPPEYSDPPDYYAVA